MKLSQEAQWSPNFLGPFYNILAQLPLYTRITIAHDAPKVDNIIGRGVGLGVSNEIFIFGLLCKQKFRWWGPNVKMIKNFTKSKGVF